MKRKDREDDDEQPLFKLQKYNNSLFFPLDIISIICQYLNVGYLFSILTLDKHWYQQIIVAISKNAEQKSFEKCMGNHNYKSALMILKYGDLKEWSYRNRLFDAMFSQSIPDPLLSQIRIILFDKVKIYSPNVYASDDFKYAWLGFAMDRGDYEFAKHCRDVHGIEYKDVDMLIQYSRKPAKAYVHWSKANEIKNQMKFCEMVDRIDRDMLHVYYYHGFFKEYIIANLGMAINNAVVYKFPVILEHLLSFLTEDTSEEITVLSNYALNNQTFNDPLCCEVLMSSPYIKIYSRTILSLLSHNQFFHIKCALKYNKIPFEDLAYHHNTFPYQLFKKNKELACEVLLNLK
jgi:hypothetical protein